MQIIDLNHPHLALKALEIWLQHLPIIPTSVDSFLKDAISSCILINLNNISNEHHKLQDDYDN